MRFKALSLLAVLAGLAIGTSSGAAQLTAGSTYVGPTIGFGNLGGGGIAIGGRLEHDLKPIPELGKGVVAVVGGLDFYRQTCGSGCSVNTLQPQITGQWNIFIQREVERQIVPFLGAGLGLHIESCNFNGVGGCGESTGLDVIGRLGAQYFFNSKTAFYADIGAGTATLNLGVMFGTH